MFYQLINVGCHSDIIVILFVFQLIFSLIKLINSKNSTRTEMLLRKCCLLLTMNIELNTGDSKRWSHYFPQKILVFEPGLKSFLCVSKIC